MKKMLAWVLVAMMALVPALSLAEGVTLTMGSWRADDVDQINAMLAVYKEKTGVEIIFQPTTPSEYNAALRLQLDNGTGPDLMYARSFATGQELFEAGFFADLTALPGLADNFSADMRAPWMAGDAAFAVPFMAVSHAVYYNKDLFAEHSLEVPTTWDEFIALCEALKEKGLVPLANGVKEEWDILEVFFLGMVPNYIGGPEERAKYESGEKPLNDETFVQVYTDFASVAPYLDENFASIDYNDSQMLFGSGRAAMFMDGSWTISAYEDVDFEWGVFALPARDAKDTAIAFHQDCGITMNTATEHPEEAEAFLAWLCTPEGVSEAYQHMPKGFFPLIDADIELADAHSAEFLALNEGRVTDTRFVWPAMIDLYADMNQEVIKLLKGEVTPQEAADNVQAAYEALK